MSEEAKNEKPPVVFISYSHDSEEHCQWVLALATKLRDCGVDVLLDQWELGPGDDVPKFMEKAVAESDRMLMICTEQYVRKADEGKGGVGYEAMIVTGELVKNLGTNKFIPVIRQSAEEPAVPKSVSTRLYVNLSDGQKFEEGAEKLVREIQNTPKLRKPPLGKNPYAGSTKEISMAGSMAGKSTMTGVLEVKIEDAESAFLTAREIVRSEDFIRWRELVRSVKEPLSGRLNEWRKKYDGAQSMEIRALPGMVLEAATIYSPLMAVALAGVESGHEKFSKQTALLDEFLRPRDWNAAGLTVVGSIPDALVFTYQALHGATCMEVDELGLAVALSRSRVARAHHYDGVIIHEDHQFIGWPESFDHRCTMAWDYLTSLGDKWPWLRLVFGTSEDYRASLSAYYMALSIQELAVMLASGRGEALKNAELRLDIPVAWVGLTLEIRQKAYRQLVRSAEQVRNIWRSLGVSDKAMAAAWPAWTNHAINWAANVFQHGFYGKPEYCVLFEDVRPQED
jgi:hypothetical protein